MSTDKPGNTSPLIRALYGVLAAALLLLLAFFIYCALPALTIRIRYRVLLCAAVIIASAIIAARLPAPPRPFRAVLLAAYALIALLFICWRVFSLTSGYRSTDSADKAGAFSGRSVMLIVPHQDDELNLLGGVFEQFISYGSELRVVFFTTGDYNGVSEGTGRMAEALSILTAMGLPEENVIFLGYSDSMSSDGGHFLNLEDEDERLHSADRSVSKTYGLPCHPAYNDGHSFTRAHALADMKSCILEYRPDTIICVDQDSHRDHRAVSLLFDKVMGSILSESPDYRPLVLKGFAYCTGYYAPQDFYDSANLISTVNPASDDRMADNGAYFWSERLRLPVSAEKLSRSLFGCGVWKSVTGYDTVQHPYKYAQGFLNGDKVFWLRSTQSLTYSSSVTASSGNPALLSDFRLARGVWIPSADDTEPKITVTLPSASDLSIIRLYDAPSASDNILKLRIEFDNGSVCEAGPLDAYGSATDIAVNEKGVSSFTVTIVEREGSSAGLTELEAYTAAPDSGMKFIKLTDSEDNFVYDYITASGEELFSLYAVGAPAELNEENYRVSCENPLCSAKIEGGAVHVSCPEGEATLLRVESADGSVSDGVYIRNPRFSAVSFWMGFEKRVIYPFYESSVTANLLRAVF